MESEFRKEIEGVINKYSKENGSNTPDFILARYLDNVLLNFDAAVSEREEWYGRIPKLYDVEAEEPLFVKEDYPFPTEEQGPPIDLDNQNPIIDLDSTGNPPANLRFMPTTGEPPPEMLFQPTTSHKPDIHPLTKKLGEVKDNLSDATKDDLKNGD